MPGLTVTEKEHWKDRLAKRIERKIEVLKASDPGLFTRLNREARVQTLQSLGLAELSQHLETIEKQEEECQKQKVRIEREMVAIVRGVTVEDLDDGSGPLTPDPSPRSTGARGERVETSIRPSTSGRSWSKTSCWPRPTWAARS